MAVSGILQHLLISIHALREEGDTPMWCCRPCPRRISIHALREEGDCSVVQDVCAGSHFYPRPPRGGRRGQHYTSRRHRQFLSTPSARRATDRIAQRKDDLADFYPRPPRGGRHTLPRRDARYASFLSTPSARRATQVFQLLFEVFQFLSTPSARRATSLKWTRTCTRCDFYPRPPRGGRPWTGSCRTRHTSISIHALREEGDSTSSGSFITAPRFLSTPSARRATHRIQVQLRQLPISIHALREEGDFLKIRCVFQNRYFYPRPPRGGRRMWPRQRSRSCRYFYPRPPRGGRLCPWRSFLPSRERFLSTPSARRATRLPRKPSPADCYFYPRPPRGGRLTAAAEVLAAPAISIHALREEGDKLTRASSTAKSNFYPRPPRGGRRVVILLAQRVDVISIHALREEGDFLRWRTTWPG